MGRTERRVLVLGSIVFLLALNAAADAAAPSALDEAPRLSSHLPASPAAFAERAAASQNPRAIERSGSSFRSAVELIVLAATCGLAVAFYSASGDAKVRTRVPMRVRRR